MEKIISMLVSDALPMFETWLRQTVSDEVSKALEADRQKQKPEKMLNRQEVCDILDISLPTLWEMTKHGKINATRIGRRVLYSESEVKRLAGQQ